MKKFYAFAAMAVCALGAMAQDGAPLYSTGNFEASKWAPDAPVEFEYVDGAYVLDIQGVSMFKVSTATGEGAEDAWAAFNAGALTCEYGEEPGATVELTVGDNNIACPWEGDWHVVVAGDLSTVTLTTDSPKPATAIFFRGGMVEGWAAVEEWQFESVDGNVYKFECAEGQAIEAYTEFKVADSSWGKINYGLAEGDELYLGVETVLASGGGNMKLDDDFTGVAYFDLAAAALYMDNDKEAECPFEVNTDAVNSINVENAAPVYYNLQGVRVANPENGLYIVVKGNKTQKVVVK